LPLIAQPQTTTIAQWTTTKPYPSNVQYDCDFENDCKWTNAKTNDFDWTVVDVHAGQLMLDGPTVNHNGDESGAYLIANTSAVRINNAKARYESLPMNNENCIEFWYYLNGPEVCQLFLFEFLILVLFF
jgi:hypothetical protein